MDIITITFGAVDKLKEDKGFLVYGAIRLKMHTRRLENLFKI